MSVNRLGSDSRPCYLQQIEVPETLLKKRKATDKAREERLAAALAARKVSLRVPIASCIHTSFSSIAAMMISNFHVQLASLSGDAALI